jgi:hypothetical protein
MSAVRDQESIDADLELAIDIAYDAMLAEPDDEKATGYFRTMRDLIAQRSPAQVKRMERERRLRTQEARS